nr:MAG TPA: hypothetical protein [Caudoviricetes sp.]
MSNEEAAYIKLPITFPNNCLSAVLSDTYGKLSTSSASGELTEGAKIIDMNVETIHIQNGWTGGLDMDITIFAIGN